MNSKTPTKEEKELVVLIRKWKLNQTIIAEQMEMPVSTFRLKLNETGGLYHFTKTEFLKLGKVVSNLFHDVRRVTSKIDTSCIDLI